MKIIPSFKPAVSYKELAVVLKKILFNRKSGIEKRRAFENSFAAYLGVKHAICVPSGRWGLYYILKSLRFEEGDEIILPAFTYFAVPAAIVKSGLKPVFVDINPGNLNIDVQKIKENITDKTRAIIPTYLCGFACDLDALFKIAKEYNIKIIEDCAQSLGADYKGKKLGSLGDAACFTFGITKSFTTLGGGMITTNDDNLMAAVRYNISAISPVSGPALALRLLKAYIMKFAVSDFIFPLVYFTMRLFSAWNIDIIDHIFHEKEAFLGESPKTGQISNVQAELGMAQLKSLDKKIETRTGKGLELYGKLKKARNIRLPLFEEGSKDIFSGMPVLTESKKDKKRILLKKGIDVSAGYMKDCARLEMFKEFRKACPNASKAEDEILYLPLYAELSRSDLEYIAETITESF